MMDDFEARAQCAYDLQDALEELQEIVEMVRPDNELDEMDFRVSMAHLYCHFNSAWNRRNLSSEELKTADHDRMNEPGQFPTDLKPL